VIALHYHRPNSVLNALAAAALLMLIVNPLTLFDLGFQLSFLATLGLILYVAPLTRLLEYQLARIAPGNQVQRIIGVLDDSFIVTLAAQITTTPILVFAFHRFSLVGVLTNFIVLPVQPAVMLSGGIATLVAMIAPPLGQVLAWIAWAFLEFTIVVVQATSHLPFATLEVGRFDLPLLALYYALLFGLTLIGWRKILGRLSPRPILACGLTLVIGMWVWNATIAAPDGKTHITFLDGATTFVQTPHGVRVLIDGGANPSAVVSALGQRLPFWDRAIDLVVLTNPDEEHVAALVTVLERFQVH
jgi:competence protein ComEC